MSCNGQLSCILKTKFKKRFTKHGDLFALFGGGEGRPADQTSKRSDARTFATTRNASNNRPECLGTKKARNNEYACIPDQSSSRSGTIQQDYWKAYRR